MAAFKGEEILQALGIEKARGSLKNVERVVTNSWQVKPGDLYVALKGNRFDGHSFLDHAAEAGARGVVVNKDCQWKHAGVTVFPVEDTVIALGKLARFHRERFSIPVIGVTGSVGKTSTKDLIAAALSADHEVLKTQGNFNNEIGLPLTLLELNETHRYAVIEMGMRGVGEIAYLAEIAQPTIGVVTNVEDVHIERLGSREAIALAKSELIAALPAEKSLAFLSIDDPYVIQMKQIAPNEVMTFGRSSDADVQGQILIHSRAGLSIHYNYQGIEGEFFVPLYGRHQLGNILAAVGLARYLGIPPLKIQQGLSSLVPSPMRMEPRNVRGIFVLNDAYNANPRSMVAALQTFVEIGRGHRVALLGDMFELGELTGVAHREILLYALNLGIEKIILTGEAMRQAQKEILSNRILYSDNLAELVRYMDENLYNGDSLLVKGSRGMKMEEILKAWSDSVGS